MVTVALALLVASQPSNGVPSVTLASLRSGANVTRWFCYLGPNEGIDHFNSYFTNADLKEFKKLHFTFCRLCISPDAIYQKGDLNLSTLSSLDRAVDRLIQNHITVIWDLHDNGQLKIDQPGSDREGFVRFWSSVAKHYRAKSEHQLIFELLNEPVFQKNPDDWYALQERAVKAIRLTDPSRTIMVSSTSWSSIDTLNSMKPLKEKNLLYTFHCYDPFFFTHQGAEWVGEYPGHFQHVPFPSSPAAVDAILSENDPKYRETLQNYGKSHYDDAYLADRIAKAVDWGKRNRVPVLFGEFGAYPKVSPPESRARWFIGMRRAIDAQGVPSSIWGYDDALGLGRSIDSAGNLHLDPVTLKNFYRQ